MGYILDKLFFKKNPETDWIIVRMRAIEDRPIGPRYPTGLFAVYNPAAQENT